MYVTNTRPKQHNLTDEEKQAINKLQECTDIIIKPADKGSATVIMDRDA